VVHSRDDEEVEVAHKVKSPENQFSQTIWQYWLGKLSPNKLSDCFQKVAMEFKYIYLFNGISTN